MLSAFTVGEKPTFCFDKASRINQEFGYSCWSKQFYRLSVSSGGVGIFSRAISFHPRNIASRHTFRVPRTSRPNHIVLPGRRLVPRFYLNYLLLRLGNPLESDAPSLSSHRGDSTVQDDCKASSECWSPSVVAIRFHEVALWFREKRWRGGKAIIGTRISHRKRLVRIWLALSSGDEIYARNCETTYARYLESKSLVLRMMNFVTSPPSSFSFRSLSALKWSLADASLPRMMWFSKFLRKSFFDPKKLGFAKLRSEKYSERSF